MSQRFQRRAQLEMLEDRRMLAGVPTNEGEYQQALSDWVASNPLMHYAALRTPEFTYGTTGYVPKPGGFFPSQDPSRQVPAQTRVVESEPVELATPSAGVNNTPATAQLVNLGFGLSEFEAIDIRGTMAELTEPISFAPAEDDGSIILANDLRLVSGQSVRVEGALGDGPNVAFNFLDIDFFAITGAVAGDVITAHAVGKGLPAGVDPAVILYDAFGRLLAYNDDLGSNFSDFLGGGKNPTTLDAFLAFDVPEDGDYYLAVVASSGAGSLLGFEVPSDPFDSFTKVFPNPTAGDYVLTVGLNGVDSDHFAFQLDAGDIFGANISGAALDLALYDPSGTVVMMGSSQDLGSSTHPAESPLPTGGNAALGVVIPATGTYYLRVIGPRQGGYLINSRVFRPVVEDDGDGVRSILYLDFNGAELNNAIFGGIGVRTQITGLGAFLRGFNLHGGLLDAVIDATVATVRENFNRDMVARGNNPSFELDIRNSRDHADPFGLPNVSRVVIGGTFEELFPELGPFGNPGLLGIAESVDVGNFDTEETAIVLLDLMADIDELTEVSLNTYPINTKTGATKAGFVGTAIGNIVSHEAGHFYGGWHTDDDFEPTNGNQSPIDLTTRGVHDLMDKSTPPWEIYGVGPDRVWGTRDDWDKDFSADDYDPDEHFRGLENTLNAMAFVLTSGRVKRAEAKGAVWNDLNGNGTRETGEGGLRDALVYADLNLDGRFGIGEPAARTDANGLFTLGGLEPGLVTIRVQGQPGWVQTVPAANGGQSVEVSPTKVVEGLQFAFRVGQAVNEGFDRGDAPAPYPTARAGILPGLRLGNLVDGDGDLPLNDAATGDDTTGVDDEDGVVLLTPLRMTQSATVQINAFSGGNPRGLLQGWIDFDQDGVWEEHERIVKSMRAVEGANEFTFAVPATAVPGATTARFRLAYEPDISPSAMASAGEIEDYVVTILPPPVPEPTAVDDVATVAGHSSANAIDVLANDIPNAPGGMVLVAAGSPSQGGGVAINPQQNRVLYTPALGFAGLETFTYTVRNSLGGQATATVSVTVTPFVNPNPVAEDDEFNVDQDSVDNVLTVLANDTPPTGGTISISQVGTPSQGGEVSIGGGGQFLVYTPAADFFGTDTFTYIALAPNGNSDEATVTVNVTPEGEGALARFRLRAVDDQGEPVQSLAVGEEFTLEGWVDDLRPGPQGVFSAYVDVVFSADQFDTDGVFAYGPGFDFVRSGQVVDTGAVLGLNDVGAVGGLTPTNQGPHLLFSIDLTPTQAGVFPFQTKIADDQQIGIHDVVLYGLNDELTSDQIRFNGVTLTVGTPVETMTNPANALDVNNDGAVSPVDGLLVINALSKLVAGATAAERQGEGEGPRVYPDVNGDGLISPVDALLVINRLNELARLTSAPAAAPALGLMSNPSVAAAVDAAWSDADADGEGGNPLSDELLGAGPLKSGK